MTEAEGADIMLGMMGSDRSEGGCVAHQCGTMLWRPTKQSNGERVPGAAFQVDQVTREGSAVSCTRGS